MCNEVGGIDFEDKNLGSICPPSPSVHYQHYEHIFNRYDNHLVLAKPVIFSKVSQEVEKRTMQAAKIASRGANISAKTEVNIEWGGKGGPSVNGSISGSVSDDKGNKAEIRVEVERDGSGKATISAEHEKKT